MNFGGMNQLAIYGLRRRAHPACSLRSHPTLTLPCTQGRELICGALWLSSYKQQAEEM